MLQLVHHFRRGATHELDGVLVAEVVRALYRVVHVPMPVIGGDVTQRRRDAALRRHGVRARGEHFRQYRHFQPGLRQSQRGAHSGSSRADYHHVKSAFRNRHHIPHRIITDQITYSNSASTTIT